MNREAKCSNRLWDKLVRSIHRPRVTLINDMDKSSDMLECGQVFQTLCCQKEISQKGQRVPETAFPGTLPGHLSKVEKIFSLSHSGEQARPGQKHILGWGKAGLGGWIVHWNPAALAGSECRPTFFSNSKAANQWTTDSNLFQPEANLTLYSSGSQLVGCDPLGLNNLSQRHIRPLETLWFVTIAKP